jgi:hypothetical protein
MHTHCERSLLDGVVTGYQIQLLTRLLQYIAHVLAGSHFDSDTPEVCVDHDDVGGHVFEFLEASSDSPESFLETGLSFRVKLLPWDAHKR